MATRHIVVGLDGSPGSEAAARWCVEMAPLLDADVVAVDVLRPLFGVVPPVVPVPFRWSTTRPRAESAPASWTTGVSRSNLPASSSARCCSRANRRRLSCTLPTTSTLR